MKRTNYTIDHSFWCIKCGRSGIPLPRNKRNKKERFHRKKMYCPYCKIEINHVECKTQDDVLKFKMMYADGAFAEEVAATEAYINEGGD